MHRVGNQLDLLSEIYNTAFSKLPKVFSSSDAESVYSYSSSAVDNSMEYGSLDVETNNMLDVYRNPNLIKRRMRKSHDSSIYEEINVNQTKSSDRDGITEVYIKHDNEAGEETARIAIVTDDFTYSSGEKMMISIASNDENVFSDKGTSTNIYSTVKLNFSSIW